MRMLTRAVLAQYVDEAFRVLAPAGYLEAISDGTLGQIIEARVSAAFETYNVIAERYDEVPDGTMSLREQWDASSRARIEAVDAAVRQATEFAPEPVLDDEDDDVDEPQCEAWYVD